MFSNKQKFIIMKTLFLADLSGCQTQEEVKKEIADYFDLELEDLERFAILVGYVSVGSGGCYSSAYFLLEDHKTKQLYEVFGSHCSCYGFEDQWERCVLYPFVNSNLLNFLSDP